jgi:hypothetical protein
MEPENHSVHFQAREIKITFDEYIQLKDLPTQLVVSPPLAHPPESKIHKKNTNAEAGGYPEGKYNLLHEFRQGH